ncbi:hypothetical protein XBKQ1_580062 [Xenorhabdus bovienii str. kraussei Quebec]|uniref:Uncharacterized protein n=1 Tax=Xenorhabdus bovienii str. kraussei Quebec TaxID=1398203 RepID=A0A077PB43_XENBV|nr:hypothetical protein XBKQ1_580062 [Xenorhabdus bovienii str. kraussei Quebec]
MLAAFILSNHIVIYVFENSYSYYRVAIEVYWVWMIHQALNH